MYAYIPANCLNHRACRIRNWLKARRIHPLFDCERSLPVGVFQCYVFFFFSFFDCSLFSLFSSCIYRAVSSWLGLALVPLISAKYCCEYLLSCIDYYISYGIVSIRGDVHLLSRLMHPTKDEPFVQFQTRPLCSCFWRSEAE